MSAEGTLVLSLLNSSDPPESSSYSESILERQFINCAQIIPRNERSYTPQINVKASQSKLYDHLFSCAAKAVLPMLFNFIKSQLLFFTRINHILKKKKCHKLMLKCAIFQVLFSFKKEKLNLATLERKPCR